jgi:hypothetical protein
VTSEQFRQTNRVKLEQAGQGVSLEKLDPIQIGLLPSGGVESGIG